MLIKVLAIAALAIFGDSWCFDRQKGQAASNCS